MNFNLNRVNPKHKIEGKQGGDIRTPKLEIQEADDLFGQRENEQLKRKFGSRVEEFVKSFDLNREQTERETGRGREASESEK